MSKRQNYYSQPEHQTEEHLLRLEEEYQQHRHTGESIEYHGDRVLPYAQNLPDGFAGPTVTQEDEKRLGWDMDRRWMIEQMSNIAHDKSIEDGHPLDFEAAMSWVVVLRLGIGADQRVYEGGKTPKEFLYDYYKLVTQDFTASLLILARVLRPTMGVAAELLVEEEILEEQQMRDELQAFDAAEHGIDGRREQERAGDLS